MFIQVASQFITGDKIERLKVVVKAAVQVKVMQALMAKAKTNLPSKYQG
ncbi:hypothetical protein O9993_18505 [Vibrio lentus]|nr:hypothetical protein [Vibrio lentus]